MSDLNIIGERAKSASLKLGVLKTDEKNQILIKLAEKLISCNAKILEANKKDMDNAVSLSPVLKDRLMLNEKRIEQMAEGLLAVVRLKDPTGEFVSMDTLPNGLQIGRKRVPMGVIGIIYEARPNVTADAFALCLKAGSASIFRGGKEAINTNMAIIEIFQSVLNELGYDKHFVQLIEDTSRQSAIDMMKLNKYIDVLIPRGGAGLIQSTIENSTIPVIETGVGNCHLYVDESADFKMALDILINGKVQRPSVCNALEKLLVHKRIAPEFLPLACEKLKELNVAVKGDVEAKKLVNWLEEADKTDWGTEYLDLKIAVKVVGDINEAINHINTYGTGHSEAIITENYSNSQKFLNEIDAAAVYVNASTRFTDGFEFGLGAEIGISTQKLHSRGPMGLTDLTTTKFVIYGSGQIRN